MQVHQRGYVQVQYMQVHICFGVSALYKLLFLGGVASLWKHQEQGIIAGVQVHICFGIVSVFRIVQSNRTWELRSRFDTACFGLSPAKPPSSSPHSTQREREKTGASPILSSLPVVTFFLTIIVEGEHPLLYYHSTPPLLFFASFYFLYPSFLWQTLFSFYPPKLRSYLIQSTSTH